MVQTSSFSVETKGFNDIIDITNQVESLLAESSFTEGSLLVFAPGATAGITTIEYEPGCVSDLKRLFDEIIPNNREYSHNLKWGDGNGHSHIRAAILKASFSVPFEDNRMFLGTWQNIIFVDFDNRSRNRKLVVQLMGE